MDENVRRLRKHFDATKRTTVEAADCCDRCGLTAEELTQYSRQLELHHIRSISSFVRAGIIDPDTVNARENIQVLCTFCHVYWHKIAEPMKCSYQKFFNSRASHLDLR